MRTGGEGDDRARTLRLLSVVAPMHNEAEAVEELYRRMVAALDGIPFELVLADDGSTDETPALLDALADRDPRVKVVHLSRNFGHQASVTAGLEHASGDAVAMIDGDLQDPPELLPELLEHWRRGVDVVYAVREDRAGESRLRLLAIRRFYALFARIAGIDVPQNSGDFRLLDRRALDVLLALPERNRFIRGMTSWIGFTQVGVGYRRDARETGASKYSYRKLLRFSFDAITSFSYVPLQLATALGFVFSMVAFLALPLVLVARLFDVYVPGVSTLLVVVLLLGGIQLITVGIIGEYVGRIYDEVKRRPLYVVAQRRNLAEPPAPGALSEREPAEIVER